MRLECLLLSLALQVLQGRGAASNSMRAQGRQGFGGTEELPPLLCLTQLLSIPAAQARWIISRDHLQPLWKNMDSAASRGFGTPPNTAASFYTARWGHCGWCWVFQGWQASKGLGGKHMLCTWLCTAPLPPSPLLKWQFVMHGAWELCMQHPRNVTHRWYQQHCCLPRQVFPWMLPAKSGSHSVFHSWKDLGRAELTCTCKWPPPSPLFWIIFVSKQVKISPSSSKPQLLA